MNMDWARANNNLVCESSVKLPIVYVSVLKRAENRITLFIENNSENLYESGTLDRYLEFRNMLLICIDRQIIIEKREKERCVRELSGWMFNDCLESELRLTLTELVSGYMPHNYSGSPCRLTCGCVTMNYWIYVGGKFDSDSLITRRSCCNSHSSDY